MHVVTIDVTHLGNRTHLVHDGRVGVVVDPPRDYEPVEKAAAESGIDIVAVAETHIHHDYVSGGLCLSRRHGAAYLVSADEDVDFARVGVHDNETLAFGDIDLRVIATPGHTPLHQSYLATDATAGGSATSALFSGGSLLYGAVGRTDLVDPTLTTALTRAQWLTAHRLAALDGETALHPTHGFGSFCASATAGSAAGAVTIADQRAGNPVLTMARDDFVTSLLGNPAPVPSHYARMAPRNRRGAWIPRPGTRIDADQALAAVASGAEVVDVRSIEEYAAGHVPGTLAIPAGPHCAIYTGWVTPWGSDLVLVSDSGQALDSVERELASIGIEGVATAVLSSADIAAAAARPSALRRTDWTGFAAAPPGAGEVVLDVRRPDEWRDGHLDGALNIAVDELPRRLEEVPPGEVWVHCAAGYRAAVAAGLLDRAGRDVVLVDDDFERVAEIGIPLLRERSAA